MEIISRILFMLVFSFSEGNINVIGDTIIINDWWYLGPFSIGAREGITGLKLNLYDKDFVPDTSLSYPSLLAQGGFVKWKKLHSDNGLMEIKYEDVEWDTIQDYYGVAGLISAGIAYTEFESNDNLCVLINAQNVGSFILNGRTYPGNVYRDHYIWIPAFLRKGKNKIILKPSGYGEHSFSLKILKNSAPLMVIKDFTVPDFIKGESYSGYIGVPFMNTTEKIIEKLKIEIYGDAIEKTEREIQKIMPLSVIKIPLTLKSKERIETGESTLVKIRIYNKIYEATDSVWIMIRKPGEPYLKTFISKIDNSCQHYAILRPQNFNSEFEYSLIMSCHGAGVEAINQVKSYSQKDWAYVVAPTNRRRYGFDWQDWGRLDFLEVLEDVKRNFKIDEDRIYLTGHSMGGHGVWHIGLSHPDLFAGIAPSAGWINFQLYMPWFLQRSETFAQPEQIKFRDMVLREDNVAVFLENALNLPIYILHGGADDIVPPIQGRMMAQYLREFGYDFVYNEVEGKGHWWDIDSTPGVDCVDLKEMMEFLREKKRDPYPESIIFKTSDIGHSNKAYWIRIDEIENIYRDSKIIATVDTTGWIEMFMGGRYKLIQYNIQTENIRVFTVRLKEIKCASNDVYYIFFNINGKKITLKYNNQQEFTFVKSKNGFSVTKYKEKGLKKTENLYGPIKQAYFSPFILVYGTIGDSIDTENNLHQARLQSYTWWIRGNGFVEIIPDTEITQEYIKNFNLILFGNAKTNAFIKRINKRLPINFSIEKEGIAIHNKVLKHSDLCLMEIYPNPLNLEKFVFLYSATTKKAQKYLGLFPVIYSGSGLPDFIIWDESAERYGWAGIVAAGFFDKRWRIDKSLLYSFCP